MSDGQGDVYDSQDEQPETIDDGFGTITPRFVVEGGRIYEQFFVRPGSIDRVPIMTPRVCRRCGAAWAENDAIGLCWRCRCGD